MKIILKIIKIIIVALMVWISITTFIQAIKQPRMTNTELLLNIPNSFILNFK